jgi:ATP-dependent Lon protease
MPRDNSYKSNSKASYKKVDERNTKKKKNDNNSDSEFGSDSDDSDSTESDKMNVHELRKYIKTIFPSKHIDNKIQSGEKLKKISKTIISPKNNKITSKNKKISPKNHKITSKKHNKKIESSEESSEYTEESDYETEEDDEMSVSLSDDDTEDDADEDEYADDEEEEETYEEKEEPIKKLKKSPNKVNIVFTIGKANNVEDEYDDEDDEYDSGYSSEEEVTEDEDEEVSTDESSTEEEEEKEDETLVIKIPKKMKDKEKEKEEPNEVLKQLKELLSKNQNDKYIGKCIEGYENDLKIDQHKKDKKEKKQKAKNARIFKKIMNDKNIMNDYAFYEKLEMDNQKKYIKELKEINKIIRIEKPYRMTLLEADIPVQFKAYAIKKINSLKHMDPGSGDFYKIKNWVDAFMKIPFNIYHDLPISIEDGVEKCHDFMENAKKTLDESVYGLNDAKMQIMQMLGQLLTNPKAIGTAIAIHGAAGTGKTSIVKEGISKILNRPFAFIALGGATDSSFLEGHGFTYEGSTWGKIVQILIDSKCMNPVIYFDELDKISDTPRGEEITGILTHLTDTSQNSQFHDKFFSEIDFDLSKCLFIFSYNDESKINPILRDRMYRIKTKGYSGKEKTIISNNYLLPKIRDQVKFTKGDINISDDVLAYINDTHCQKEEGVRNMKRCLEIIHTKLNLYRLMKPSSNLFEGEMSLKVSFPFNVTKDIVDKLIKKESDGMELWRTLYV